MYYKFNEERLPHISRMDLCDSLQVNSHSRCAPGECAIFYIKSGKLRLHGHKTDVWLTEGDLCICGPDSALERAGSSLGMYYFIYLEDTVFSPWALPEHMDLCQYLLKYRDTELLLPGTLSVCDPRVRGKVELILEQALFASSHRLEHHRLISATCFMHLLTELASYFSHTTLAAASPVPAAPQQRVVSELTRYLHGHYGEKLTGTDLERQFGMNFDYLNRLFKKQNGMPVFTYLNKIRIDRAVELLTSGHTKSFEIAQAVGYSDEYYFSKVFKKQLGISPKNYLKLYGSSM